MTFHVFLPKVAPISSQPNYGTAGLLGPSEPRHGRGLPGRSAGAEAMAEFDGIYPLKNGGFTYEKW